MICTRPLHFHQTALNRQITEAVKIGRFGEENLLNSKGEFNRSRITRLTLGDNMEGRKKPVDKEDTTKVDEEPADVEEEGRKTTDNGKEEDDLPSSKMRKEDEEFERLEPGCWGEVKGRLVEVPGLQPYLPLPQRKEGRLRGKVARATTPSTQPGAFRSLDIRDYFKPEVRVKIQTGQHQPNVSMQVNTFAGSEGTPRWKRKRLKTKEGHSEEGRRTGRQDEKNLVPADDGEVVLKSTPPVDRLRKGGRHIEEDFCQTPRKGPPSILVDSGRKRPRQDVRQEDSKKVRLMVLDR